MDLLIIIAFFAIACQAYIVGHIVGWNRSYIRAIRAKREWDGDVEVDGEV